MVKMSVAALLVLLVVAQGAWAAKLLAVNQSEDAKGVLELVNEMRKKEGLDPVQYSSVLEKAVDKHGVDMAVKQFLSTTGSDGTSLKDRAKALGFEYRWVGAFVTQLDDAKSSSKAVFEKWMSSGDGFKEAILNTRATNMAVSKARGRNTAYWALIIAAKA